LYFNYFFNKVIILILKLLFKSNLPNTDQGDSEYMYSEIWFKLTLEYFPEGSRPREDTSLDVGNRVTVAQAASVLFSGGTRKVEPRNSLSLR